MLVEGAEKVIQVFAPERLNLFLIGALGVLASIAGMSDTNIPNQLSLAIRAAGVLAAVLAWLHVKNTSVTMDNHGITVKNFLGRVSFRIAWAQIGSVVTCHHAFRSDEITLYVDRKRYKIPTIISDRTFLRQAVEARLLDEGGKEMKLSHDGSVIRHIRRISD